MTLIVPRWEWRAFDQGFGSAEAALDAHTPDQVVESSELYLLSTGGRDVVKVRDDLMDVKRLHEVSEDGLERWSPVLKAPFPLSSADLAVVMGALGLTIEEPLPRTTYTLAQLHAEVLAPSAQDVRAVEVHKARRRYFVDGCRMELTDVRTEEASTRSIAVESEDAARVLAAVEQLGLATRPNVSYLGALRVLGGFGCVRCAVIDVGTNSVKFHIGDRAADGSWQTVADRAEITRLGDGLRESGRLNPEPMARTLDAITAMAEEARSQRVDTIAAVGTAGLRIAPNGPDFAEDVLARCGVHLDIISGEDEARLAYRAAVSGLGLPPDGPRVVFDTGGGSSQFTFGEGDGVDDQFSVEVGAVRFTEQFGLDGPVSRDVLDEVLAAIGEDLRCLRDRASPDVLVGMGGGLTNLAAVRHELTTYDPDVVQGTVLDAAEIDRQIELYRTRTPDERRGLVGLQPQRAETILAGACIVRAVLGQLGMESVTVSDRGLRYGVLAERFGCTTRRRAAAGPAAR